MINTSNIIESIYYESVCGNVILPSQMCINTRLILIGNLDDLVGVYVIIRIERCAEYVHGVYMKTTIIVSEEGNGKIVTVRVNKTVVLQVGPFTTDKLFSTDGYKTDGLGAERVAAELALIYAGKN